METGTDSDYCNSDDTVYLEWSVAEMLLVLWLAMVFSEHLLSMDEHLRRIVYLLMNYDVWSWGTDVLSASVVLSMSQIDSVENLK